MDSQKELALLCWVRVLIGTGRNLDSLRTMDYGATFIRLLQRCDSSISVDDFPTAKQQIKATKDFLEDFYNTCFVDDKYVDFNILSETVPQADLEIEIAKVLLLLLCAGIQERNSEILSAALQVHPSLHQDISCLVETVVQPNEPTTSLPRDFAEVFLEQPSNISKVQESPVCSKRVSLDLNDSLQQASTPSRLASVSSSTPLEELVNSPQMASKILRVEKEQKYKLKQQLREKELKLQKLQHDLRLEVKRREELQVDLEDSTTMLDRKDSRISQLEQQVQRLQPLQSRVDELNDLLSVTNSETEHDLESERDKDGNAELLKKYYQTLGDENKQLYEEVRTLQDKINDMEDAQAAASKSRALAEKLKGQVTDLETRLEAEMERHNELNQQNVDLVKEIEVLRDNLQHRRRQQIQQQQHSGSFSSFAETSNTSENMGVVTDLLVQELRQDMDVLRNTWTSPQSHQAVLGDLDELRNTWTSPRSHQATLSDLQAATANVATLEEESQKCIASKEQQIAELLDQVKSLKELTDQKELALSEVESCRQTESEDHAAEMKAVKKEGAEREMSLQEAIAKFTQQTEELSKTVEHLETTVSEKESDLQEVKTDLTTKLTDAQKQCEDLMKPYTEQEEELKTTIDCLREESSLKESLASQQQQELFCQIQELTNETGVLKDKLVDWQEMLHLKEEEFKSALAIKEDCEKRLTAKEAEAEQKLADLKEESQKHLDSKEQQIAEFLDKVKSLEVVIIKKEMALTEFETHRQADSEKRAAQMETVKKESAERESSLQESVAKYTQQAEELTKTVERLETTISEKENLFEQVKTDLTVQLTNAQKQHEVLMESYTKQEDELKTIVDSLREEISKTESVASEQQLELQRQIEQLKNEATIMAESSENYKETVHKVREKYEEKIRVLSDRMRSQKEEVEASSDNYWKLQLANLKDVMESDMRQQQLTYENDLAEREAEYESRLSTALIEQEVLHLHEKDALEDKLTDLQKTLLLKEETSKSKLAEKEADWEKRLAAIGTETEQKPSEVKEENQKCLDSKEQQITELLDQVKSLETLISQKEIAIIELESCRQTESEKQALETDAAEKENTERELQIKSLEAVIHQKDSALCEFESNSLVSSGKQTVEIEFVKKESAERKLQIESLKDVIFQKETTLRELESHIQTETEKQSAEIEAIKKKSAERELQINSLESVISQKELALRELEACSQAESHKQATELKAVKKENAEREMSLQESVAKYTQQAEELTKKVECLETSLSENENLLEQVKTDLTTQLTDAQKHYEDLMESYTKQEDELKTTIDSIREEISKLESLASQQRQELLCQVKKLKIAKKDEKDELEAQLENYWRLQLTALQEEMEKELRQQRRIFENELAEQRAEYETHLHSALNEQEGMHLGQKALLEDKLVDLQETMRRKEKAHKNMLIDKETDWENRLTAKEAEMERKRTDLKMTLRQKQEEFKSELAEKEIECEKKMAAKEAEVERKLANLEQCLQKETASQHAIRVQMKEDRAKIQELTERMEEMKKAKVSMTSFADSPEVPTTTQPHLIDGSFNETLPETPARNRLVSSGRSSMSSVGSAKSTVFMPVGAGRMFSCEEEPPESPKFEWGRLNELQRRNTLCLPHMKSSYPVETQVVKDIDDDAVRQAHCSDVCEKTSLSTAAATITSASLKRNLVGLNVEEGPVAEAAEPDHLKSKMARHGPGTPKKERGRPTKVVNILRHTPKPISHKSPWLSPRKQTAVRHEVLQNPRRESVAFSVGFSPVKTGHGDPRRLTRQKTFYSKKAQGTTAAMEALSSSVPSSSKIIDSTSTKPASKRPNKHGESA